MSQDSRHGLIRRFATLLLPMLLAGVIFSGVVNAAPEKPQANDKQAQKKDAKKDAKSKADKKKSEKQAEEKKKKAAAEKKAAEEKKKADAEKKAAEEKKKKADVAKKDAEKKAAEKKKSDEKAADEKAKKTAEEAARSQPKKHQPVDRPDVFSKKNPENLDDLKAIENQVAKVAEKALKCVVGVRVGAAQGSAVIISEDGYVLTAGHVCGTPGRKVVFLFADGKTARGITLGVNRSIDSGLMKITDKGPWPHVDLGVSKKLKPGDWTIAIGHPRGFQRDRPPVVRTGRVILANERVVQTGCTLFSGDSGGPLFDVDGRVIAIHSRIGGRTSQNFHVPIDAYHDTWDRLAVRDIWPEKSGAMLGVNGETVDEGCRITRIYPGLAGDEAGLKVGDIVTKFDGRQFTGIGGMSRLIRKKKGGDKVVIEILRDGKEMKLKVTLSSR
jgi:serine protease Do